MGECQGQLKTKVATTWRSRWSLAESHGGEGTTDSEKGNQIGPPLPRGRIDWRVALIAIGRIAWSIK
jgi:hypothetical protein